MAKYGSKGYVDELINKPPEYTDSADTLAAKDKMTEYESKISTEPYKGTYTEEVDNMVKAYLGKDKFNYNPNNDATYQQLRDTYLNTGKTAMQDTLGSGVLLSGGNNNSAAQVVAQQVYNDYARKVSDVIPTLEAQAYDRYRTENADLLNNISLLSGLDDKEYSRHQNEISNIMNLLNYYGGKYQTSVSKDQTQYGNDLGIWSQQLSAGQSEYQNSRSYIFDLLTAGVDVDYALGESVGIDKNTMDAIKSAVKASASVSSGVGGVSSEGATTQQWEKAKSIINSYITQYGSVDKAFEHFYAEYTKYGLNENDMYNLAVLFGLGNTTPQGKSTLNQYKNDFGTGGRGKQVM